MPLQNRVTPESDIVALPDRGLFMGNRGILHDADQRLHNARWRHPHWIICVLSFKNWHREVMQPGAYTELFFLDEVTALAAGHRPCALCQRAAYLDFQEAIRSGLHKDRRLSADDLDRMLHAARIEPGTRRQRRFEANLSDLPDGTMVRQNRPMPGDRTDGIWLVQGHHLQQWRPSGYDRVQQRQASLMVDVLTPRPTVLALKEGYKPTLHPSAVP
ncbi:MAG: hypothetical protein ACR2RE_17530 [Geminicoccaceae bacterium]